MIYLLDLNYTLVANSPPRGTAPMRPFSRQIEQETYRQWLTDLLRPEQVILITARPHRHRQATLDHIRQLTGWQPMDACFAVIRSRPPQVKQHALQTYVFPRYGPPAPGACFALESNPMTRDMYSRYAIPASRISGQQLTHLPRASPGRL